MLEGRGFGKSERQDTIGPHKWHMQTVQIALAVSSLMQHGRCCAHNARSHAGPAILGNVCGRQVGIEFSNGFPGDRLVNIPSHFHF